MPAAPVNLPDINTDNFLNSFKILMLKAFWERPIRGTDPDKPAKFPALPENECVGVVIKAAGAPGIATRDTDVIPIMVPGIGKSVNGANEELIKISKVDVLSAATITVNPCTAFSLLKDVETLKPGDRVNQKGGNSAVGQAMIQLCREVGLKCLSLVRPREDFKQHKAKLLTHRNSGTVVITFTDQGSRGIPKELARNCSGGKSATDILRMLGYGTMLTYGGMYRQPVIISIAQLIFNDDEPKGLWTTRWNFKRPRKDRQDMLKYLENLPLTRKWVPPEYQLMPSAKSRTAVGNTMVVYSRVKPSNLIHL